MGFCDGHTDWQTDGLTDRQTFAILELLSGLKNAERMKMVSLGGESFTNDEKYRSGLKVTFWSRFKREVGPAIFFDFFCIEMVKYQYKPWYKLPL